MDNSVIKTIMQLLFRIPIDGYRYFISPLLGGRCRFVPTCSEYAQEAIMRHGACTGSLLILKRLARCHPWGGCGHDPVP